MVQDPKSLREQMVQEPKSLRERAGNLIVMLVRDWRPTPRQALWILGLILALSASIYIADRVAIGMGNRFGYVPLGLVFLFILIHLGYQYEWTGFNETSRPKYEEREIQPRKTLWDWMQLLFVPAMLAILAAGVTWWQTSSERARQVEEAARQEALRAQNTAVQPYLGQMSTLILEKNLRDSEVDSEVRTIAQARTSTVLQAVQPENQRTLLQFLSDTRLIQQVDNNRPIISLDRVDLSDSDLRNIEFSGSNLSFANLSDTNLSDTNLSEANLRDTKLSDALLPDADLSSANLLDAFLTEADLTKADLSGAHLRSANLRSANLREAHLFEADLSLANLYGTNLRSANLSSANLSSANLSLANLSGADFRGANLSDAFLGYAYLRKANLSGANLSNADLSGAEGITNEQLEQQAASLEGATMPDGSKHP